MAIQPTPSVRSSTVREATAEVESGVAPQIVAEPAHGPTALASTQTTAVAATSAERHRAEIALGTSLMAVGGAWSRHPVLVAASTTAAYAGVVATGAFNQLATSPIESLGFTVAMAGFGAAFLNWVTGNGLAQPLFFKGVTVATEASRENLNRAIETDDVPLARKSLGRLHGIVTAAADVLRRGQPALAAQLSKDAKVIARDAAKLDRR